MNSAPPTKNKISRSMWVCEKVPSNVASPLKPFHLISNCTTNFQTLKVLNANLIWYFFLLFGWQVDGYLVDLLLPQYNRIPHESNVVRSFASPIHVHIYWTWTFNGKVTNFTIGYRPISFFLPSNCHSRYTVVHQKVNLKGIGVNSSIYGKLNSFFNSSKRVVVYALPRVGSFKWPLADNRYPLSIVNELLNLSSQWTPLNYYAECGLQFFLPQILLPYLESPFP